MTICEHPTPTDYVGMTALEIKKKKTKGSDCLHNLNKFQTQSRDLAVPL